MGRRKCCRRSVWSIRMPESVFRSSMWSRPRRYRACWRANYAKNEYFCRGEARPWGPPHAGNIVGPYCKGLTSARGPSLEASTFGFSTRPTLLTLGRRQCIRRRSWRLGCAESASGAAPGGIASAQVLQAKHLEEKGGRKCSKRSSRGGRARRKCFRRSNWMRRVAESASGVALGGWKWPKATQAGPGGSSSPKVLQA